MAVLELIVRALIAMAIGVLVGLEREHHSRDALVLAGARTYPLIALFGLISAYLSLAPGAPFPGLVHVSLGIVALLAMVLLYMRVRLGHYGITSAVAMIITFLCGVLLGAGDGILSGYTILAVFISVALTFFLIEKYQIHDLASRMSTSDIAGAAEFMLILLVLYPLALALEGPIDPYGLVGPGEVLDPGFTLTIVIIVSLMTFGSFAAVKIYGGSKGILFSGFLGGLMSSEAMVASLSRLSRDNRDATGLVTTGVMLSTMAMVLRNLLLVMVADPSMLVARYVALPLVGASAALALMALVSYLGERRRESVGDPVCEFESPFALKLALEFALVFTLTAAATHLLLSIYGSGGLYVMSLGGLFSSSAVAASIGNKYALGGLEMDTGAAAGIIIIATALSILNRLPITYMTCRPLFRRLLAPIIVLTIFTALMAALPFMGFSI